MAVRHSVDIIALAHHADDQAETVLLQLLRGGAPRGLGGDGGMACQRRISRNRPRPADAMETVAPRVARRHRRARDRRHGLSWIDDESNDDVAIRRNFLRARVLPVLETGLPGLPRRIGARRSFVRRIRQAAREPRGSRCDGRGYARRDRRRGPARAGGRASGKSAARNAADAAPFRFPPADRLREFARQVAGRQRKSARPALALANGRRLCCDRGFVRSDRPGRHLRRRVATRIDAQCFTHGVLSFTQAAGAGIDAARIPPEGLDVRPRTGGCSSAGCGRRPRRTLKNLMQEARIPAVLRPHWPMLTHGTEIVAIPGIGVGVDWHCPPDAPGWVVRWQPRALLSA